MNIKIDDPKRLRIDLTDKKSLYYKMGYSHVLKSWINEGFGNLSIRVISYHKSEKEAEKAFKEELKSKFK